MILCEEINKGIKLGRSNKQSYLQKIVFATLTAFSSFLANFFSFFMGKRTLFSISSSEKIIVVQTLVNELHLQYMSATVAE